MHCSWRLCDRFGNVPVGFLDVQFWNADRHSSCSRALCCISSIETCLRQLEPKQLELSHRDVPLRTHGILWQKCLINFCLFLIHTKLHNLKWTNIIRRHGHSFFHHWHRNFMKGIHVSISCINIFINLAANLASCILVLLMPSHIMSSCRSHMS